MKITYVIDGKTYENITEDKKTIITAKLAEALGINKNKVKWYKI